MRTPPDQKRVGRPGGKIHYQAHQLIISEAKQRFSRQSRCDGKEVVQITGDRPVSKKDVQ